MSSLAALSRRYHAAFNDRDFDVWRSVFAEDVDLLVDGMMFRGIDAAIAYGEGSVVLARGGLAAGVAEALTNVSKHARATQVAVSVRVHDRALRVTVRDDGVGGAGLDGNGLVGVRDRLAALDGRLRVKSPRDGGTLVAATIPLRGSAKGSGDPSDR